MCPQLLSHQFTGEIAPGMGEVQQTPQFPILSDTRWAFAIDGMIVNGVAVIAPTSTLVYAMTLVSLVTDTIFRTSPGLSSGQLLTNLDTGTARG